MDYEEPAPPFELGEPPSLEGVEELKQLVQQAFPAEAELTDRDQMALGDSSEANGLWFERFATAAGITARCTGREIRNPPISPSPAVQRPMGGSTLRIGLRPDLSSKMRTRRVGLIVEE